MVHYPIPPALKRWLVPCWNAGHRYGWLAYDYSNAFTHGRFERCSVCGRFCPMLYRRRVIPPRLEALWALTPRLAEALARKESCDCAHCGAKLRARRMAQVLLSLYSGDGVKTSGTAPRPPGERVPEGRVRGEPHQAPVPPSPPTPLPVGARGTGAADQGEPDQRINPRRPPRERVPEGRVKGDRHSTVKTGPAPAARARSLARWVEQPEIQALRVAEINRIDGLHDMLARLPRFACSDYAPGAAPGAMIARVRSEDLTRLTYPDASFDLVLTSETLEHVPDLSAALREIHRVLAPAGLHVFTIPLLPHVPRTFARAIVLPDGSVEQICPRICHPGGEVGYPVFTEFGADLGSVFEAVGFSIDVYFGPNRDDDLAQVYVSRKKC
jgi:SAM-dependent methyltransferase